MSRSANKAVRYLYEASEDDLKTYSPTAKWCPEELLFVCIPIWWMIYLRYGCLWWTKISNIELVYLSVWLRNAGSLDVAANLCHRERQSPNQNCLFRISTHLWPHRFEIWLLRYIVITTKHQSIFLHLIRMRSIPSLMCCVVAYQFLPDSSAPWTFILNGLPNSRQDCLSS